MKKYLFSIGFLFVMFGLFAQDNSLGYNETWVERDSVGFFEKSTASDSIVEYEVFKRTNQYSKVTIQQGYDSVSGAASTVNIYLQSKMFDVDEYSNIDTIVWSATTNDTVIKFNVSTATREEYYRVYPVPDAGTFIYGLDYTRVKFQY